MNRIGPHIPNTDFKAPPGKFRVISWDKVEKNGRDTVASYRDELDYDDYQAAKERAQALAEGGSRGVVYDDRGHKVATLHVPGEPIPYRYGKPMPVSIERLCGLPEKGRRGTYKRRR